MSTRDDDLAQAFRAVRDRYDGSHHESDATLRRVLVATRQQSRTRRLTRWVVLPLAATLAASTAWAGATGRLSPAIATMLDAMRGEHPSPTPDLSALATPQPPTSIAPPPPAVVAEDPTPTPAPETPVPVAEKAPLAPPSASTRIVQTTPIASAPDPNAPLFEEAHRIHFTEHDPARALAAWDRYLAAAPRGRFAPEARYNRALSLVRLGRHAEAKTALTAFASGTYGEYRRADAKALLEALSRDE